MELSKSASVQRTLVHRAQRSEANRGTDSSEFAFDFPSTAAAAPDPRFVKLRIANGRLAGSTRRLR